jgi:hypothetical protein
VAGAAAVSGGDGSRCRSRGKQEQRLVRRSPGCSAVACRVGFRVSGESAAVAFGGTFRIRPGKGGNCLAYPYTYGYGGLADYAFR